MILSVGGWVDVWVSVGVFIKVHVTAQSEWFNDWGRRGYDDSVPGEVTKTPPSGDMTT